MNLPDQHLVPLIDELKQERQAVILAHIYQRPEIQEMADFVGDSLQLSQLAARTTAEVIVFCGVHFMAESAAILSPEKKVLLPEANAGCPMADMVTGVKLRDMKTRYPNAVVVTYVNSSAEVKAESDICCTSSNAVAVVASLQDAQQIIFVPDRNLGHYVSTFFPDKEFILWPGFCPTHERLTEEEVRQAKTDHPQALLVVHPECRPGVVAMADGVYSTAGMIKYCGEIPAKEFIIGTECGILHQLQKTYPEKVFYQPTQYLQCPNMKRTTLPHLLRSLETLTPVITVPEDIRVRATGALQRMIAIK